MIADFHVMYPGARAGGYPLPCVERTAATGQMLDQEPKRAQWSARNTRCATLSPCLLIDSVVDDD